MEEVTISNVKDFINVIQNLSIRIDPIEFIKMKDLIDKFEDNRKLIYEQDGEKIVRNKDLKNNLTEIIKLFHKYHLSTEILFNSFEIKGNRIYEKDPKIEYLYRGVYDGVNYNLLPSCFRGGNYEKEDKYYHYIKSRCSSEFNNRNHLDTLVTLQHYDCPTRLLDVTYNPLVALYFACKNYNCSKCDNSLYGYVYVFATPRERILFKDSDRVIMLSCLARFTHIELLKMHDACVDLILKKGINAIFDSHSKNKEIDKLYHEIRTEIDFEKRISAIDLLQTYFVQPDYTNKRIDKQNGAFIISGLSKNQEEIEQKINYNVHTKIKILNRSNILKELDKLNINEATLFPELDKVSRYYVEKISKEK